jgi:hypothetical protein
MKLRPHYRKWLRYYLDYCLKYGFDPAGKATVYQVQAQAGNQKSTGGATAASASGDCFAPWDIGVAAP